MFQIRATLVVRATSASAIVLAGVVAGCRSTPSPTPLTPEAFYGPQTPSVDPVLHPQDRPGVIDYEGRAEVDDLNEPYRPLVLAPPATFPSATTPVTTTLPTTQGPDRAAPASTEPLEPGVFQVVGFVVAEVNGNPIFADEVIKQLRSLLAAEARKLDREQFRQMAMQQLQRQVDVLIVNELEYAAADRELPAADKRIAELMTQQWRGEEITKAGGSEQLARQRYSAQGVDFDEEARRRYRGNLLQVFTHRKIMPLVRVSADDIRDYYSRNIAEYTEFGEATFRVIKIDPKKQGGRDAAERKARDIRARAIETDFAKLAASEVNDNLNWRATGGLVEGMKQDSYVLEKVEDAVWAARPGDVTDVIADGGAFYVAKVESLKPGHVKPFADVGVQTAIRRRLENQQFQRLREQYRRKLEKDAVVRGDSRSQLEVALDMIMQNYDAWASAQ
jgi:parvulin-like peptidyl-prolyl isomerase